MLQSRGDKADDVGKINLSGRTSNPFQSNFGASNIVSYTGGGRGDSSEGRSMQNFNRRQAKRRISKHHFQTGAKIWF
jgi:hypothetical protein